MPQPIEAIVKWKMTDRQATAYRMGLAFERTAREMFPNYKLGCKRKGDPRESELFKWAYKAINDNAGRLRPHEYRHYVHAQLAVAKAAAEKAGTEPLIWPGLLAGPRAWRRWEFWKARHGDLVAAGSAAISDRPKLDLAVAEAALVAGRRHVVAVLKGVDCGKLRAAMTNGSLPRWVALGQVPGHMPLLSPAVQAWMRDNRKLPSEVFGPGIDALRGDLCPELEEAYRRVFPEDRP